MASDLDIVCDKCGGLAQFEFALIRAITRKADRAYFEKSRDFLVLPAKHAGSYKRAAYFPNLGNNLHNISRLPEGHSVDEWQASKSGFSFDGQGGLGVLTCASCHRRRKHELRWPDDAYFRVDYRGHQLWAYNRANAVKLLNYIRSDERKKGIKGFIDLGDRKIEIDGIDSFLHKIPKIFQSKKARHHIVEKLEKRLQPV